MSKEQPKQQAEGPADQVPARTLPRAAFRSVRPGWAGP